MPPRLAEVLRDDFFALLDFFVDDRFLLADFFAPLDFLALPLPRFFAMRDLL
jgi:hypothetical protein